MTRDPLRSRPQRLVAALAALALAGCSSGGRAPAPASVDATRAAYVGMQACRSCHLGVHSTYSGTGMARSFRAIDPGAPAVPGASWIVGSGHHLETALAQREGGLERLPVCRRAGSSAWDECADGSAGQGHVARSDAAGACRTCHDVADPAAAPSPRGVDCERCHGPGELHVRRWKGSSEAGTGAADPTIVNPRRLAAPERMAVCLQCHLGDPRRTARILRAGRAAGEFRPGMPLGALWSTWRIAAPAPQEFGVAAQGDRLVLSRCFRESAGRMDCTTCHNPHVSVYHEDRPADLFRVQCLGCHEEQDCIAPADARAATRPADDCAACHMRRAEPHDQRGTTYTDHWIRRSPDAGREAEAACELEPLLPGEPEPEGDEEAYYRAKAWLELTGGDGRHACAQALDRAFEDLALAVERGFALPEARELLARRGTARP